LSPAPGSVDALVEEQLAAWKVPGLALGILEHGETSLRGYGVSSLETGEAVTPETSFRIASITKPMVGTLCLALGLPLDEPVWEDATLRLALSHQLGIDGEPDDPLRFGDGDDALDRLLGELGTLHRWFPAGELWSYQNAGYWLAGREAARTNDSTFERAMLERIFEPLGLTRTGFEPPDATGHQEDGSAADGRFPRARRPSGGVVSTVGDLLRFAEHHFDHRETHERQVAAIGGDWTLGWGRTGGTVFHPGSWGGYESLLLVMPDRRYALAILTNGPGGYPAYTRIVDALLGRSDPPRVEAKLDGLTGRYARKGMTVEIEARDGGLYFEAIEDGVPLPPVSAYPIEGGAFHVPDGEARGARIDFPRPDFVRFGSRLAQRT
jgi:CubicO group peptidase (beta-lactamase class C family)